MPKISEYRLDSEFQLLGQWFLTSQTLEESIKGTLHYSEEEITLELYDTFGYMFDKKYNNIDFIYGFSNDGKTIVLHNLSISSANENFPGFPTINYYVQDFFVLQENYDEVSELYNLVNDITSESFDSFVVKKVLFSFDYLTEWINQSSIQSKKNHKDNIITLEADLGNYDIAEFEISNRNIILKENVIVDKPGSEHLLNEEHQLIIRPLHETENMEFSDGLQNSINIKNLIEFFVNSPLKFSYIEFQYASMNTGSGNNDKEKNKTGRYFFRGLGERLIAKPQMNIKYTDISSEFELILNKWFLKQEELEFIIDSFIGDIYLPNYINTQLLNSIRNLEIYHRNFIEPKKEKVKDEHLEEEKGVLIDFVENKISEQNQNRFIRNIKYDPEMTLNQRLMDLFKKLPNEISVDLIKESNKSLKRSIKSFAYKLTQIRNYYTHGDDKKKYTKINEIIENGLIMYEYNRVLVMILKYFIYSELGMSENMIREILK